MSSLAVALSVLAFAILCFVLVISDGGVLALVPLLVTRSTFLFGLEI
jgi:hypothetical protein